MHTPRPIPAVPPALPDAPDPWALYRAMVDGVPEGIAVTDICVNVHWTYVEAECGMGISRTVRGGARTPRPEPDPFALELHQLAALACSWDFTQASLGIAALNAWYAQPDRLAILGAAVYDGSAQDAEAASTDHARNPFHDLRRDCAGKKVVMVGHFPNAAELKGVCDLTVLERDCRTRMDTPDTAAEFVLPAADTAFITGTTLTNKTAGRLLQLTRTAETILVGPSAVPAPALLKAGANLIAGSAVVAPDAAKRAVKGGTKEHWRAGIRKFMLRD